MPRYLVERSFPDRFNLPDPTQDSLERHTFVANNTHDGVTWVRSYVSSDCRKSFCIYDAPSPEALRRAAERNNLPIDRISEVSVLDPYSLSS